MPFGDCSSRFELEVVLDDAVVDDDDPARAVAMRVRVLFGRPAVRGPAGVAEAVQRRRAAPAAIGLFEIDELAGAAPDFDARRPSTTATPAES